MSAKKKASKKIATVADVTVATSKPARDVVTVGKGKPPRDVVTK